MKETRFIAQNKEKWLESETLLNNPIKDPEKLSSLFIQVVDDLSYSRTYYPNRSVRVYLNKIARQYFSIIYSHKHKKPNRFKMFWLEELPQIILYCKKQLLISLFVFLLAAAIGVFSSLKDPEFAATIMGESYVSMTQKNIESGDPMAVYKKSHQIDMFLGITFNNLMVAFRIYVFGIFMAIGTLALLLYNGIMVGCFQFFFIERGLFVESALSIWLHGTLEISSIILAGGAGLTLGSGLLFPGTYSRFQSLQLSAMRSLKLMLGVTPIFVIAAVIESFLTRYTDAPDVVKLVLIILSASFIIVYFVLYPWLKSKQGFKEPLKEVSLPPGINEKVSFSRLKNNAEILKDTFLYYSRNSNKLLPWILIVSICLTFTSFLLEQTEAFNIGEIINTNDWWRTYLYDMMYALRTPSPIFILINTTATSIILYRVMKILDSEASNARFTINAKAFIQIVIIIALIYTAIYLGGWGIFFLAFSFAIFLLIAFTQLTEKCGLGRGISISLNQLKTNVGPVMELQLILVLLSFSFLLVLSAPLIYMHTTFLKWNFSETDIWAKHIIHLIELFIKTVSFYLILPVLAASTAYLYFTLKEISSAAYLKNSIAQMGIRTSKNIKL